MPIKVVYNAGYGGFSLSRAAMEWLAELGMPEAVEAVDNGDPRGLTSMGDRDVFYLPTCIPRHHPLLVMAVEHLGPAASGPFAKLDVCEIQGRRYLIQEYDGAETVLEPDDLDWIEV